ncbi:MAG: dienelactone hydrolase family protein [Deltaproteobacteria bacterium]|nr:MAG: dienelactone hydrolase family protein [Deltaproteobacteria bacterium]
MHVLRHSRLALLFAASLLVLAQGAAAGGRVAQPDALGPWAVGRTTFAITDPARNDRPLQIDAWYPVDPVDATAPPSVYELIGGIGILSEVALDAPPVSSQGPFPMIVFSHGSGGVRFQSFFLTESLASHGFVVVAPDHTGNTALDSIFGTQDPFEVIAVNRPADVSFLIDTMLAKNADALDPFRGAIDASRIGVSGHSFGGFTALAVASGFGPVPADSRVRAIVPISPASSILSDAALASIEVPAMLLSGTADITTPIDPQTTRPFALLSSQPLYRVDIVDAGHNSFTETCAILEALLGVGIPPEILGFLIDAAAEGCAPELIPIDEAHRIAQLYAVAFFQRHVAGAKRYKAFLTRGVARDEPDAEFSTAIRGGGPSTLWLSSAAAF